MAQLTGKEFFQVTGVINGGPASTTETITTRQIVDLANAQSVPVFAKMRAAAAFANGNNLAVNPISSSAATVTTYSTAPSTTGLTNLLPAANGFLANITGNTTAGSNIVSGISSFTSLKVGQPFVEKTVGTNGPVNINYGAIITAISSAAGTVTISLPALLTITAQAIQIFPSSIRVVGIPIGSDNGFACGTSPANASTSPPTLVQNGYALEFMTDAANFNTSTYCIYLFGLLNGPTVNIPNMYKVAIDDVYQTATPQPFGSGAIASGTPSGYLTIQFTAIGVHKVRIELPQDWLIQGLFVTSLAQVWKSEYPNNVNVAFLGDSFTCSGANWSWGTNNMVFRLAYLMGWQLDTLGIGGTGYVVSVGTYPNSNNFAAPSRSIAPLQQKPYDIACVLGSVNDSNKTPAAITAAALQTFQNMRATLPNAPIFVFGCQVTVQCTNALATIVENAVLAAFQVWNDANAWFIPFTLNAPITGPGGSILSVDADQDGPWLTATNNQFAGGGYERGAIFNGTTTTSSAVLTVNSITSGTITPGDPVLGTGLNGNPIILPYGTSSTTGTGQAGTYALNIAQTTGVGPESMTCGDFTHPTDPTGVDFLSHKMAARISQIMDSVQTQV